MYLCDLIIEEQYLICILLRNREHGAPPIDRYKYEPLDERRPVVQVTPVTCRARVRMSIRPRLDKVVTLLSFIQIIDLEAEV